MLRPSILTASASGFRRWPLQASQGRGGLEAAQLLAHPDAVGLAEAPLHVGDDAFERLGGLVAAHPVVEAHGHGFLAGAEQDDVADLLRQLLPRQGQAELVVLGEAFQRLHVILRGGVGPGRDRAVAQALLLVRHHQLRIEIELAAEAVADRAGAERVVEGEQPRLDLVDGEAGDRAGEARGEDDALALVGRVDEQQAVGEAERGLHAVGQAGAEVRLHRQAVDHHLDIVLQLLVEGRDVADLVELAVDPHALEAALLQVERTPSCTRPCGRARSAPADRAACPPAASMIRSTIWLTVWLSIGRPVAGE